MKYWINWLIVVYVVTFTLISLAPVIIDSHSETLTFTLESANKSPQRMLVKFPNGKTEVLVHDFSQLSEDDKTRLLEIAKSSKH